LALPEHRVRLTRDTHQTNVNAVWGLFSLLEFDIVCYNDVCKQSFDFVDRKELMVQECIDKNERNAIELGS
jgi:hypothetical protein